MPDGVGQTLTQKAGPLPVWAWAGLGTAGLAGFLIYRNKKAAAAAAAAANQQSLGDSSSLGTVPVSDLTTSAQPMPIQMGDTFVNVPSPSATATATVNNPPSSQSPNMTLSAAQLNTLIHTPPTWAGYTGASWSKLTPAQKQNLLIHTPAPGYSGIAWSQMPLASRLNDWVAALKKKPAPKK